MKIRLGILLAVLIGVGLPAYSAFAVEDTPPKKPKSLWVSDNDSSEDENAIDEDEPKSNKTKLGSKKNSGVSRIPEEENRPEKKNDLKEEIRVDKNFAGDAKAIAISCTGNWESEVCLKATSQSALVLISQFGASLEHEGHKSAMEPLKQECAASTAATQEDGIPAYAMKSAYTVCANKIADIAEQTGVKPDPSYYQLMIATILCMDKNAQCALMEKSLEKWAK